MEYHIGNDIWHIIFEDIETTEDEDDAGINEVGICEICWNEGYMEFLNENLNEKYPYIITNTKMIYENIQKNKLKEEMTK